jgi:hypothetical protein
MNWGRGLFRTWIAVSAIWVVFIGVLVGPSAWRELTVPPPPSTTDVAPATTADDDPGYQEFLKNLTANGVPAVGGVPPPLAHGVSSYLYEILAPPLSLLAIGIVAAWVVRGFRSGPKKAA